MLMQVINRYPVTLNVSEKKLSSPLMGEGWVRVNSSKSRGAPIKSGCPPENIGLTRSSAPTLKGTNSRPWPRQQKPDRSTYIICHSWGSKATEESQRIPLQPHRIREQMLSATRYGTFQILHLNKKIEFLSLSVAKGLVFEAVCRYPSIADSILNIRFFTAFKNDMRKKAPSG